jgi:DNA-directed RNA polymerase specialized sigma24 family protein
VGALKRGDFERFTVMLSVWEEYSDQGCSELLGCSAEDVRAARTRALETLNIP